MYPLKYKISKFEILSVNIVDFMSAQKWSICPQKWYSNDASKNHVTIANLIQSSDHF